MQFHISGLMKKAIDANNIGILCDLSANRGNIDSKRRDLHLISNRGLQGIFLKEESVEVQVNYPGGEENDAAG